MIRRTRCRGFKIDWGKLIFQTRLWRTFFKWEPCARHEWQQLHFGFEGIFLKHLKITQRHNIFQSAQ